MFRKFPHMLRSSCGVLPHDLRNVRVHGCFCHAFFLAPVVLGLDNVGALEFFAVNDFQFGVIVRVIFVVVQNTVLPLVLSFQISDRPVYL